jgi:hypothetical protein
MWRTDHRGVERSLMTRSVPRRIEQCSVYDVSPDVKTAWCSEQNGTETHQGGMKPQLVEKVPILRFRDVQATETAPFRAEILLKSGC